MAHAGIRPSCALLVTAALAGCIGADDVDEAGAFGEGAGGPLLGLASALPLDPRTTASLAEPPAWRLGEWWRLAFSAPPYGIEATFDRVVVGVDRGRYLVGVGGELHDGVLLLHLPAFGEIDPATLGFEAHDRPIVPLQFPLTEGATWTTQWYNGVPLEATVASVEGTRAVVRMTGARTLELEYDAAIGEVSRLAIDGYGGYEVVDHGYGYEGRVVVPLGQDLVFCHGRAMGVQAVDLCELGEPTDPRAPTESLTLGDGYDRVSFGLFLRDTTEAPVGPGVFRIDVTDPRGGTYSATKTPETPGMALYPFGLDDPEGTWEITVVAGGAGLAILEGVAYQVLDVTLGAG